MSDVEKREDRPLSTLAEEINAEHQAFTGSLKKTAEHGIRAGELLTQAKSQCKHGEWLPWLAQNFEGSERTAQEYMRLYKHRDEIRAKTQNTADLSLSGALREISTATIPTIDELNEAAYGDPRGPEDQRMADAFRDAVRDLNRAARQKKPAPAPEPPVSLAMPPSTSPSPGNSAVAPEGESNNPKAKTEPVHALMLMQLDRLHEIARQVDPEKVAHFVASRLPTEEAQLVQEAADSTLVWLEKFSGALDGDSEGKDD